MLATETQKTLEYTNAYSDYYTMVFGIIYSKTNNYDAAEDICQEVFIRFYEKFDKISNQKKWLMWSIRYVLFEYYRRKGKSDEDIEEFYNDVSMTYVNGFKESRVLIEEALENLRVDDTRKEGVIFRLVSMHNYSFKFAAKETGLTYEQVRYRYQQIRERIVRYLQKKGIHKLEDLL